MKKYSVDMGKCGVTLNSDEWYYRCVKYVHLKRNKIKDISEIIVNKIKRIF